MAEGRGSGVDIARIKLSYSILPPTTFWNPRGSFPRSLPLAGRSWRREQARPRISPASTPRVILLCPLLSLPALPIPLSPFPRALRALRFLRFAFPQFSCRVFYGLDFLIRARGDPRLFGRCVKRTREIVANYEKLQCKLQFVLKIHLQWPRSVALAKIPHV